MTTVTGHRGAGALAPENTLASFRTALECGVDAIEFDVRETADGELIVIHDDTLGRTTDGRGQVSETALTEIATLDAGDGERVSTLEDVLEYVLESGVRPRIEFKERGLGERVLEQIVERGFAERTTFSSFDKEALDGLGNSAVSIGFISFAVTDDALETVERLGAESLFVSLDSVTAADLERARTHHVEVGVWTVNSVEGIERALDFGVDLITSDRLDMVLEQVRE